MFVDVNVKASDQILVQPFVELFLHRPRRDATFYVVQRYVCQYLHFHASSQINHGGY